MPAALTLPDRPVRVLRTVEMRVRGRVQGVGFRPTVWRIAKRFDLDGDVRNDAQGVLIRLSGQSSKIEAFRDLLEREPPPLARIDSIAVCDFNGMLAQGFSIVESVGGVAHTQISPDAKICDACAAEISDPSERRFGYALTNCTHCGPRLSIIRAIPYDRAETTMAPFAMCAACLAEYRDPADRRFHAEPTACPDCGPKMKCLPLDGSAPIRGDAIEAAARLLTRGAIVAIKGLGGYQLACDATNADAVSRLRAGKRRDGKPFALMARDLACVRRFCAVTEPEAHELSSPQSPIVLLAQQRPKPLPETIAPGLSTLGVMLPTTPLHVLLFQHFDTPLVMTSGNVSDEPQIIDDREARAGLSAIASHIVLHDRAIANRVDDSVVRFMDGKPRLIRRARGHAPAPIGLPPGFENAPDILAMGGELKATFCVVKDGQAILSQHQGDLEHPAAFDDYRKNLVLYSDLFDYTPKAIVADMHPEYLSSKLARSMRAPLVEVQHHHAHVASCLCENGYPLDGPPVLGIALDGLGWAADGTFWGGEFLAADYRGFTRLAAFKPVAMPGGTRAIREPWRNLYAHIQAGMGWDAFAASFPASPVRALLEPKPRTTLDTMIARGLNAPLASSCGRLFDAVAVALGLCEGAQSYEGDAASRLEALAEDAVNDDAAGYAFTLLPANADGLRIVDPAPMWKALFDDLAKEAPASMVAMRFHKGIASALARTATALAGKNGPRTVALSGGCFQNRLLFECATRRLAAAGFDVLTHSQVPANDGGLALGQAAVAAAQYIRSDGRIAPCA